MNLVAPANFSGLGELFNDFTKASTQSRVNEAMRLADLSNPESLLQTGQSLARAGDLQTGLSLAQLGRQMQTEQRQREADQRAFEMLSGGGQRPQMPLSGMQSSPAFGAPQSSSQPGSFPQVQSPGDPSLPAGMRNNNPGNIKFVPGVMRAHTGAVGPSVNTDQGDPQTVFETPELGMQGMYRLAMRRYEGGRQTPMQLIAEQGGWTSGNTAAAQNVARAMGIGPNDDMRLNDPAMALRFARALTMQEHGQASRAYSDDMIRDQIQIVNEQRSGQRPFTPGPTGYGGAIAHMAGIEGPAPVQVASAGGFAPNSMMAQGAPQAPMQQAPTSPQMGDAMMRAQRIERALQMPSLSPAARQQLTGQLQALAPLIAAERQAAAPTDIQKNYEAARRQGFQGSLVDFMREQRQSVTVNNNTSAERAEEQARGKGLGERLNETASGYAAGEELLSASARMEELSRAIEPGARTQVMENIRRVTGFRLDPNASNVQAFAALADFMAPKMREPGSGSTSNVELDGFKASLPSLTGTPEGNAIILQTIAASGRRRMEQARIAQEWQEGRIDARTAGERIRNLPDPFAEFKVWRENAAAREQRGPQGRMPASETTIPRITTPEQHRALPPGSRYIDPDGTERTKR